MQKFQIGDRVTLASMPNYIFVVVQLKIDGSYVIESPEGNGSTLTYDNVSAEMLKSTLTTGTQS
ncbi:hypothetical protein D7V64_08995 [Acinetobacter cumulans]|uniref:Uncharacterized protein n=1 Tax=Acinetobacter cumulans TaxID=2136182 RepID=A0A3A8GCH2_9GAMM|nr:MULTISPECIES: hypothetical protein [Acinetobacter]QCO21435.1 hypothetical protein C9E88_007890 [Acinetobacter cumulans]RFS29631.1 hypothetical protein DYI81_12055 [Acinetobacter sp. SWAC5]RKG49163.1 hypothetical protein D7V68_06640 [Acinetobacter cumulans]RKG52704.1 hypothetical protein D7V64_08995 [Acinetobacter cumulans]RLL48741.1 hypothetical protein D9K79_04740 [Acinetobacter cumulans]